VHKRLFFVLLKRYYMENITIFFGTG